MGRRSRLKQLRRQARDSGLEEAQRILDRARAWTLADDGTLRDRSSTHAPDELALHLVVDNGPKGDEFKPYWHKLAPGAIWATIPWADADESARRVGLPAKPFLAWKRSVERLAESLGGIVVPVICANRHIHTACGPVGGWTPSIHTKGVHGVFATPAARACVSPRFRRQLIAETYVTHRYAWDSTFTAGDRHHGMINWEERGDVIPEPLAVAYCAEPYLVYLETMAEYKGHTGGTIAELSKTLPQLLPDLDVLANGVPPWAVPGGTLDFGVGNRWEVEADPSLVPEGGRS